MSQTLSDTLLSRFSEFIGTRMGLHFPKDRWHDLERGLTVAAAESGFTDASEYIQRLLSSPSVKDQIEVLASHLTVGETYFFRDHRTFQLLEDAVLPALIRSREQSERRLRIWTAGCCTGEEPYSIAILLRRLIPEIDTWNITILATDINPRFLQKAAQGVYNHWSLRDTPQWMKDRYFEQPSGGRFALHTSIKKMVTFSYLNLAEDVYPSMLNNTNAMDLILCRNVLMYFTPERAKNVVEQFYRSLVEGGWLIVSPSETSHVLFSRFHAVNFGDAIFYRKDSRVPRLTDHCEEFTVDNLPDYAKQVELSAKPPPVTHDGEPPSIHGESPLESSPNPESLQTIPPQTARHQTPIANETNPYDEALRLFHLGRYGEAAERILTGSSQQRQDACSMALLTRIYANQGKLTEALECCEQAVAVDKLNPVHRYLHATILQERGQIEEASESLQRALYLDQSFVLAHVALGNLLQRQGKSKDSIRHFQNALACLERYGENDVVPESEGLTAGRLRELLHAALTKEVPL